MTADYGLAGAPADGNRWMAASAYREVHKQYSVSASFQGAFERLERCEGKLSRTVPRGRGAGNSPLLPGALKIKKRSIMATLSLASI